jgi:hypothetical protein
MTTRPLILRTSAGQIEQCQPGGWIVPPLQMRRRFNEDELERRADARVEKMASASAAVAAAEHHVSMQARLAPCAREVAGQREHLDLIVDRNPQVFPPVDVKVADCRPRERPDPAERRCGDTVRARPRQQRLRDLVSRVDDPASRLIPARTSTSRTTARHRKMPNTIVASVENARATPVKPSAPATSEMIKATTASSSMFVSRGIMQPTLQTVSRHCLDGRDI